MKRPVALILLATCSMIGAASAAPQTKKGKATSAPPVQASVTNQCTTPLLTAFGAQPLELAPGATAALALTPEKAGEALPVTLRSTTATTAVEVARLSFTGGGAWTVTFANCAGDKADVAALASEGATTTGTTTTTATTTAGGQLRLRARVRGVLEYQLGGAGAFKPLSVAMTSYQPVTGSEVTLAVRKKAAATGPVVGLERRTFKVLAGRNQVVEFDFSGEKLQSVFEDEGPSQPK